MLFSSGPNLSFTTSTKQITRRNARTTGRSVGKRTLTRGTASFLFAGAFVVCCFNTSTIIMLSLVGLSTNHFQFVSLFFSGGPTLLLASATMTRTQHQRHNDDNERDKNVDDEPKQYYYDQSSSKRSETHQARNRRNRQQDNTQFFHQNRHSNDYHRQQRRHHHHHQRPMNPFETVRFQYC